MSHNLILHRSFCFVLLFFVLFIHHVLGANYQARHKPWGVCVEGGVGVHTRMDIYIKKHTVRGKMIQTHIYYDIALCEVLQEW